MLGLFKCVVAAVVDKGVKGALELLPGGKYLRYAHEIGTDAWKRHREKKAQKKLEDEIKEMIAAKADAVFAVAKQAVEEVAPLLEPREKEIVLQFVTAIPEAARISLMRKDDPTGTSLPFGFTINEPEDFVKLLPQCPVRFLSGDWVPGREDNWKLERRLGGGGFGEVWLTRHCFKRSEKPRAVKFCTNPNAREKLVKHEKQLIVQVMEQAGDHPNIVPLLECHLSGETPWLMYEFVEGGTLADVIPEWQRLASPERLNRVITVLHTIAAAVGHCHAMQPAIVHRDLKPANILLTGEVPRITDFGIGGTTVEYLIAEEKTSGYESVAGRLPSLLSGAHSPLYSSPQQRNREKPDPRDDVHALGVIAYQMLTGRLDAEVKGNWQKRLKADSVPDSLIDLIGNSTSDEATDRPKDAREWETTLTRVLPGKHSRRNITPSHGSVTRKKNQSGKYATQRAKEPADRTKPEPDLFAPTPEAELGATPSSAAQPSPNTLDELYADIREPRDEQSSQGTSELAQPTNTENIRPLQQALIPFAETDAGEWPQSVQAEPPEPTHLESDGSVTGRMCSVTDVIDDTKVQEQAESLDLFRGFGSEHAEIALRYLDNVLCQKRLEELRTKPQTVLETCATQFQQKWIAAMVNSLKTNLGITEEFLQMELGRAEPIKNESSDKGDKWKPTTECAEPLLHAYARHLYFHFNPHANPPVESPEPVLSGQKWQITVPGMWYERPDKQEGAEWKEVTSTPAEITHTAGNEYRFYVRDASDASLAGLSHLKSLTNLHSLHLSDCERVTNAGLEAVGSLSSLHSIDIWWCNAITDAGLEHLKRLTNLNEFSLRGCKQITDDGLKHLKPFTPLEFLVLDDCECITGAGLTHLRSLTNLQTVWLVDCKAITDAGLAHLQGQTNIQWIRLSNCDQITDAGVAALQAALPSCKIDR